MNVDLAEAYRVIEAAELGRRLRDARILAGATQADMAGDEVTAAYVSRIEAGQRKPEFHLLGRMAQRVGTTLEAILTAAKGTQMAELRVELDYAELSLASGDAASALTRAEAVLEQLSVGAADLGLLRVAKRVRALALESTGRLAEAVLALEDLTRTPERSADWLNSLIALSRCYRDSGEFDRAIGVGERAAETIEEMGLAGLTEAIQLTLTVAGAYLLRGDLEKAMRLCMRAAADADRYDSPLGRASAYWNASVVESKRGSHQAALDLARKALAYFEVGEDLRNLARLRTQIAVTQLRIDPPDAVGALETLESSDQETAWSGTSNLDRAGRALTRGRALHLLGRRDEAIASLAICDELLPPDAHVMRASSLALAGQIAAAVGDQATARQKTTQAVQTLTAVGADREAAQLWFELGSMLESSGDTSGALDAFRRAAASTGLRERPSQPQQSAADAVLS